MTTPELKSMTQLYSAGRRQQGVTLVEILVTVVIISVGLLGVAALHTLSLQHGQDAHVRSQATALANDIIDRMRANPDSARSGDYETAVGTPEEDTGTVAEADLNAWKNALKAMLPDGDGSVTSVAGTDPLLFTITIQWGERENNFTFSTSTVL